MTKKKHQGHRCTLRVPSISILNPGIHLDLSGKPPDTQGKRLVIEKKRMGISIGVLFGGFLQRQIDGDSWYLLGGFCSSTRETHLFPLKGHL